MLVGLLAVAALPAAIAVAERTDLLGLVDASGAIPVAALAGLAAILLARRARRNVERTLGRVGGERAATIGRALGLLGLCLAVAGSIAIGVYAILRHLEY